MYHRHDVLVRAPSGKLLPRPQIERVDFYSQIEVQHFRSENKR